MIRSVRSLESIPNCKPLRFLKQTSREISSIRIIIKMVWKQRSCYNSETLYSFKVSTRESNVASLGSFEVLCTKHGAQEKRVNWRGDFPNGYETLDDENFSAC